MAASRIVPSLDVAEDRHSGLGLRGEPAACQQLAFQCGEEALAHGVVVGVTDRPHGWAHTRLPTAAAERQRRILTTLIAVVDDVARLTPTIPAVRISRAIRFFPTARPSARNSAWTRGAPYVPRETAWIVRTCFSNSPSAVARAEGRRERQA